MKSDISSKKIVCELMYFAFLSMRDEAEKNDDKAVYHLCDLFHVVPKMFLQGENGEMDFDAILEAIRTKAEAIGIEGWVKHNIDQIDKKTRKSKGQSN